MKTYRVIVLGALVAVAATGLAVAQEAPQSGFRAEVLGDLDRLAERIVALAEAVPADRYGWRPTEGVRSVSEVCMHMAQVNYQILAALGRGVPEDLAKMAEITDKATVVAVLADSFAAARATILSMEDGDLDAEVAFFGRQWTKRAVLYLAMTHFHEHLGQSIAYARMLEVVPPWSQ